jgi:hypothetical protein
MKIFSKIACSMLLVLLSSQTARAESGVYKLLVEVTRVDGVAKNDYRVGSVVEVISMISDQPEGFNIPRTGNTQWYRPFEKNITIKFGSPSFVKNWDLLSEDLVSSLIRLDTSTENPKFENFTIIYSKVDDISYEQTMTIKFPNSIENFRQGKGEGYTFIANTFSELGYTYYLTGDIKSMTPCDSQCQTNYSYALPEI